jgi:anti-sigma factor RsiW
MSDVCPRDDIAAYVDGELSAKLSAELELHFAECETCGRALRQQRQFLSALSASLASEEAIELPEDFTKKIVVTAESSVTGLRGKRELLTAVLIFVALLLFSVFVIGGEYLGTMAALGGVAQKLMAAAAVVLKGLANTVSGGPVLLLFGVGAVGVIFCSSVWVIRRRNA